MSITELANYLLGYVEFTVSGVCCEAFLNEVMKNNLDVWAIKRVDAVTLSAKTRRVTQREVFSAAAAAGTQAEEKYRRGLPVILEKYRFRYGLFAGAVIFILFVAVMSLFIWRIDVTGYSSVYEKDRVLEVLEQNGFHVGSLSFTQDFQSLKRKVMLEFDDVAGVTINVFGNTAQVELSPAIIPPAIVETAVPCNLVAKTDGILVSVEAYRGLSVVKKGQAVKQGQLLVSGVYDSRIFGQRLVHARGKVMAQVIKKINVFVPYDEMAYNQNEAERIAREKLNFTENIEIRNITVQNKQETLAATERGVFLEYAYTVLEDIGTDLEIYRG